MSVSHWGIFPGIFYERQYGQEYGWAVCSYWRELSFDFWASTSPTSEESEAAHAAAQPEAAAATAHVEAAATAEVEAATHA